MSNKLDMRKIHRQCRKLRHDHFQRFPVYLFNKIWINKIDTACHRAIYCITHSIRKVIWWGQHMRQVTWSVLDSIYAEKLATGDSLVEIFLIWITVGVRHMPRSIEYFDTRECRLEFLGGNEASKWATLCWRHEDACYSSIDGSVNKLYMLRYLLQTHDFW